MTSKKAPSAKKPATASKTRPRPRKSAQPAPQPETVQRYRGNFICVIGFPQATKEAFGPDLIKQVTDELNKLDLHLVLQDEQHVVNLSTQIFATEA